MQKKDVYKLTNPQKNIWNMEQYFKGTAINNICGSVLVKEDTNLKILAQAINKFIENNDSFRTRIKLIDGVPYQYFIDNKTYEFDILNFNNIDELTSYAEKMASKPFEIIETQLFDFKLFRLSNNYGGFIINAHHIISDAATFSLVGSEITSNYLKIKSHQEIPAKTYSYIDYIEAEQKYLHSSRFEQDKKYWNELYADLPTVATIPSLKEKSDSIKANRLEFCFDKDLIKQINSYCKLNNVSMYNFLFAIYGLYIGRINNTERFSIGTPVLNRSNYAQKHTSGMFITTSLLQVHTQDDISFADFLHNIAKDSMAMLKHQKYDYQYLLNDIRDDNNSVTNLYDIALSYQITKATDTSLDIKYNSTWYMTPFISDSLNIHFHDNDDTGNLLINYDYQICKYDKKDIVDIHNRILWIINQIIENPIINLNDIEIVTLNESNKILYTFNNTSEAYPKDKTIVDLFEEQVEKTPDNIAVIFENELLTYRELNNKANSLAYYLRNIKKIKINDLVGIMVNRSLEMIVSIIAVLKSGAAYIPIDPTYPKDRIDYMLNNSHAKVLLTQYQLKEKIDFKSTVFSDLSNNDIYNTKSPNLVHINNPENLAYVIFTSGSTGMPKGVMLKHNNIINFVYGIMKEFKFTNKNTIASLTTISFDIFVLESLMPLLNGLKIVIANENEQTNAQLFNILCVKNKVDIIQTTPSRMQLLINNTNNLDFLKNATHILIGGEPFPQSLLNTLKRSSTAKIYNMYGPTETAVWSSLKNLSTTNDITIGKPIINTQMYILNKSLKPMPIGTMGEIYISGNGVSNGYLHNTDLTKKNFIKNPFTSNSIMYKTGDIGIYNADGEIICLGRSDNQIKLRGLRIELGEIENKINNLPYINSCIVVKKENTFGREFLCAYFTSDTKIDTTNILKQLKKSLPRYMLPSYFMQLDNFAYTPNGKIDRQSLPVPNFDNTRSKIVSPRNTTDKKLVSCIKSLLDISTVSIDDNFFELGGDSLSAINLCTQIQNMFNVQIFVKNILEHPVIQDLSDIISTSTITFNSSTITTLPESDFYEISSAQKRIYFASQAAGNNSVLYNTPGGVILDGNINIKKLENCFYTLLNRHEVFKTYFELNNKNVVQKITNKINYKLNILTNANFRDIDNLFKDFVKPFNLNKAPLFRAKYITFTNGKSALFIDMHHIISDGTSISIFVDELCKLYNDESLPKLNITYKDFAAFENNKLASGKLKEAENYWVHQFEGELPVLNMPTTYPRPTIQSFEGNKIHSVINTNTTKKINLLSQKLGITPYMLLLATYYVLLYKYTSQDDIIVGSPIVGRDIFDTYNLIGMFVNTLALRNTIDGNSSFKNFVYKIKDNLLNSYKYQSYPFDELVNKLNIKKDPSRNPLFDTMFTYQNNGSEKINFKNIKAEFYNSNTKIAKFDLSLEAVPVNSTINLYFEYATKLFEKDFIQNLSNHYLKILDIILENIDIKISDIDMLSNQEKNKILFKFNNTFVDYPKDKTIVDIFEEQVEKNPTKIAVVFENKQLTYSELNNKANSLANYLISQHISTENIVGIFLDKSIESIIAIVATLKAGACYLPIDIDYPADRINFILRDSDAKVLLSSHSVDKSTITENINIINVDQDNIIYTEYNSNNLNVSTSSTNLAYIIYTSGSTGTPKGVMIENKGVIRLVKNQTYVDFAPEDKMLQAGTIAFDASTFEIWGALLNGLPLHIITKNTLLDPSSLKDYIDKNKITTTLITPSLVNKLSEENPLVFENLKYLLTGGDVVSPKHIKLIRSKSKNINIVNCYGPTENSVCSACFKVKKDYTDSIPIGGPIANSSCFVVSKYGALQPVGIPGELWVGGDGIARGYLNRDSLTQESFIDNPFGNGKIYKTGDVAKWLPDGTLDFLGRIDNQVKIRGFRIELGEINSKILEFSDVKDSFTTILEKNSEKTICSYVTLESSCSVDNLKEYLKKSLAYYMVPAHIIVMDKLPLNINGKINKSALPEPDLKVLDKKIVLPRNDTDFKLILLFKEFFHFDTISIDDNFFELGGDSLSAINLCVKIEEQFNVKLFVKDILEQPTIQQLSDTISNSSKRSTSYTIKPIQKADYYDISSAQKRIYFASIVDGNNSILYNITGGIIFDKKVDAKRIENCFNVLISRHEAFRTYFEPHDNTVVQKVLDKVDFKLDIIDNVDFDELDSIFKSFVKPFDLSKAPLFRAKYINFSNAKSAIITDMHHIISDGTSMNIFINELCDLYNEKQLPELTITYKDFSTFENKKLSSEKLKKAEDYWLHQFKNEVPVLNMPIKGQRPAVQTFEGDKLYLTINTELTKKINNISKELEITPYMLLLACYYILLSKYTSQDDIVVGSPIANRTLAHTSSLIGMFVNTLALRNKIDNNLCFKDFVLQIKDNVLDAYKYQEYPYDELVNKLNIKRDTSRNPLFDTMFIFQNNALSKINFEGIKSEFYIPKSNISKFDLSVEAVPSNSEIKLTFEYATKLFDNVFINKLSEHYLNIINSVISNTEQKISDINILSKEERNKILYEFNNTSIEYDKNKTTIDMFEEQVEKTPNNIAIAFENKELTFKELNEKANSLANYIKINKNINRNDLVGIMVNRSIEMIVAILAVLKAGGAYIPIDPSYPKDRIEYMLKNSNSKVLLTQKHLKEKINFEETLVIDLGSNIYNSSTQNLTHNNMPDDLAYVIFTSGSTGNPKGVMVTHRVLSNFTNYCNNYVEYLKNPIYQSIVSITTISFDIFFYETIISLQKGLKIVIANEAEQNTPHLLNDLITKHDIKIIQSTPSRMQIFISNTNNMTSFKSLKYIILAGEQLPLSLVKDIHALSNITVYNGYGPSETYYSNLTKMNNEFITIGKPIYNTQMYILDKHLNPVPIGVCGEIYIAGDAVGKGYLNNDTLTKKSFIKNPFLANNIMYKTGDLGRYMPDGNIICMGRADHQIKIRGLRIELEEIEALIQKYPNIKKVAVVKQVLNNREFISGYFVANKVVKIPDLKKYLSKKLPKYMVPSYFVALDDLPYTPNGKIDRKALPLPKELLNISKEDYVAPKTEIQKQLVSIWEKLLHTKPIGINDNFFELGGDSLLAMNLNIELIKISNKLTYQDIFRYPTIAELEEKINSENNELIFSKIENLSDNYVDILKNTTKKSKRKRFHPKGILITGITGFLGAHILDSFIKKEKCNIYCIIRNAPNITARTRLHQKLNFYFGNKYDDLIDKRIFAVTGDITKPGFGLQQEELLNLANSIDTVIHSAATVSHFGNYNIFYKTNVTSVRYIIDFCKSFNKKLYHVSTIGVAGTQLDLAYLSTNIKDKEINFDEASLYIGQILDNYYTRTKFEAESYVLDSISKGLDGYILRMGHLMPRYDDGRFQENILDNDLINKFISFIKVRGVPNYILDLNLEFTPVDSASKSIYKLITHPSKGNRIFHLFNHRTITVEEFVIFLQKHGFDIDILDEDRFKYRIKSILQNDNSKNILNNLINDFDNDLHLDYNTDIIVKSDFTIKYLKRTFFAWPRISNKYLIKFINLLRSVI